MRKEYLEALENIKSLLKDDWVDSVWKPYYDIIKQTLQHLEAIDSANPSEALACLNTIKEENCCEDNSIGTIYYDECKTIKQALIKAQEQEKVLEVIKNKDVDMFNLKIAILQNSVDVYNSSIPIEYEGNKLTQEEFELLKRWVG